MISPAMKDNFGIRMHKAMLDQGVNAAELSRKAGVSYETVRSLVRRPGSSTASENAVAIAKVLGIPVDQNEPVRPTTEADANDGDRLISVYDVQASAGHGAVIDYEPQTHSLAFPPDYLRKLTSSNPRNLAIISVKGDSMEPTLLDSDIVLIDTSKTHAGYEGMFVLVFNETLHVKRIGMTGTKGSVAILSDNKAFPPFEVAVSDLEVVGKVLWYGRKV